MELISKALGPFTKNDLISLCERAVVPCEDWRDRDSASAQNGLYEIYIRLNADIPYTYRVENEETIWISFEKPTDEQLENISKYNLCVDTVDDYRERVSNDPDYEMFYPGFYDIEDAFSTYMPTEKRLLSVDGEDWY